MNEQPCHNSQARVAGEEGHRTEVRKGKEMTYHVQFDGNKWEVVRGRHRRLVR